MRVSYLAPPGCPAQADFEARVAARTDGAWTASDRDRAIPMRVFVERVAGAWRANLEFEGDSKTKATRTVTATNCDAAVEAIALATALLIESRSTGKAELARPSAASPTQENPTQSVEPVAQSVEPVAQSVEPGAPQVEPGAPQVERVAPRTRGTVTLRVAPTPQRSTYEWAVGLGLLSGIGSGPALGVNISGGLARSPWLLRLGISAYDTGYVATRLPDVDLRVRLLTTRLEACRADWSLASDLRLLACFRAESGILFSQGAARTSAAMRGASGREYWLMPGVSTHLRYGGNRWFLQVGPDLFVPITHRNFEVTQGEQPPGLAYSTPILVVGASAMVGMHFL